MSIQESNSRVGTTFCLRVLLRCTAFQNLDLSSRSMAVREGSLRDDQVQEDRSPELIIAAQVSGRKDSNVSWVEIGMDHTKGAELIQ